MSYDKTKTGFGDWALLWGGVLRYSARRLVRAPSGFWRVIGHGLKRRPRPVEGMPQPPSIATIAITPRCPLHCWHCSERYRKGPRMDPALVSRTIDDLVGLGTSVIALTGGEPLLCPDLSSYLERIVSPSVGLVFSSGWGMSEPLAAALAKRESLQVVISIDHSDPATHDELRGREGAHRRALAALEMLRDAGVRADVSTLATRERIESGELEDFLVAMKMRGVENVQIFQPRPVGALAGCRAELLDQDHVDTLVAIARSAEENSRYPFLLTYPVVEHVDGLGCCGGVFRVYVDAGGNVCPCDFHPVSFGRIQEEPIADIWRRMAERHAFPRASCAAAHEEGDREMRLDPRPAGAWRRLGPQGYRFLIEHLYFSSSFLSGRLESTAPEMPERDSEEPADTEPER